MLDPQRGVVVILMLIGGWYLVGVNALPIEVILMPVFARCVQHTIFCHLCV